MRRITDEPFVIITPGLDCNYFLTFFSAIFQNVDSGTKLTAKNATTQKYQQIRRLRDLNPVEDVPDQESAENREKQYFPYMRDPSGQTITTSYEVN